jgi:hypothetical protein
MHGERVYKCLGPAIIQYSQGSLYVSKITAVDVENISTQYFSLNALPGSCKIPYGCIPPEAL